VLLLITRDIRQIVDAYGNNESIVSNCHVRIAYAPNQYETADLLSKMTGVTTVPKASYSFSGSRFSPVMQHVNASVDYIERPLMTPDEVSRLKPPQKEGEGDSEKIVAPGQMLIFVSGHYPILGTQMLYFLDPVLSDRAELPPPVEFVRKPTVISESICTGTALRRVSGWRTEESMGRNGSRRSWQSSWRCCGPPTRWW